MLYSMLFNELALMCYFSESSKSEDEESSEEEEEEEEEDEEEEVTYCKIASLTVSWIKQSAC